MQSRIATIRGLYQFRFANSTNMRGKIVKLAQEPTAYYLWKRRDLHSKQNIEKDQDFKRKRLLWEVVEDEKLESLQNKAEMIA